MRSPLLPRLLTVTLLLSIALLAVGACFNPDGSGNQTDKELTCTTARLADCSQFEKAAQLGTYYAGEDRLPSDVRLDGARICGTVALDGGLLAFYISDDPVRAAEQHREALAAAGMSVGPLLGSCGRSHTFARDGGAGSLSTLELTGVVYVDWDGGR
jgi:hypothetical protein